MPPTPPSQQTASAPTSSDPPTGERPASPEPPTAEHPIWTDEPNIELDEPNDDEPDDNAEWLIRPKRTVRLRPLHATSLTATANGVSTTTPEFGAPTSGGSSPGGSTFGESS